MKSGMGCSVVQSTHEIEKSSGAIQFALAFLTMIAFSWAILPLPDPRSAFTLLPDRVQWRLCSAYPRLAWRIGTGEMQVIAAESLSRQVQPGMSYEQVTSTFGVRPSRDPLPDGIRFAVGFRVRGDGGNEGVTVYFAGKRVVDVVKWD